MEAITCDVCGKTYRDDYEEIQEFHYIDFYGGYNSVFGDSKRIMCDICQYCLKKMIGKYCYLREPNGEIIKYQHQQPEKEE